MRSFFLLVLAGLHTADAQSAVISCSSTKCVAKTSAPYVEIVSASAKYSMRCCTDTPTTHFVASTACPGLYASSTDLSGNCVPNGSKTFAEAEALCASHGARLCTTTENLADCSRVAQCGLNALKVWAVFGDDAPSSVPSVAKSQVPSIDVTPAPTPAPVADTPAPTAAPVPPPGAHDDPHFYTWQGALYDYHGVCDMIYTTCPNYDQGKGFHMHLRTEFVEPTKWSTISSLAVKIGDDVFEAQNNGSYYVNGVPNVDLSEGVDFAGHKLRSANRFDQGRLRLLYQIELEDDSLLEVLVKSPKNDGSRGDRSSLSFQIKGAHEHRNNGGNAFSDCVGLSNTWEQPEEGKYLVGRSGELYEFERAHEFAPEWQVDQDKNDPMLFFKDVGLQLPQQECIKSPILVADHRHLNHLKEADGGALGRQAEEACSHLSGDTLYDACVFDVLVTGDTSFAEEPWYNK
mmetsp:Transcript_18287/g.23012  ORF Transcript_18287/g.23012 Transcript_18287/m.23012 type:complete len:460 (+) Transcript_18287:107-1486(+)